MIDGWSVRHPPTSKLIRQPPCHEMGGEGAKERQKREKKKRKERKKDTET